MSAGARHEPLDFGWEPACEDFRAEVCHWLTGALADLDLEHDGDSADRTGLTEARERALLREAGERGLLGISLPGAVGGGGRPASWAAAFAYEVAWHHAPLVDTGAVLASEPVIAYGTAAQRAALLPGMLDGRETWCCAYTEHTSGNDLVAGIATGADVDRSGVWRLTGHKALVTGAAKADRCLTVAQTPAGLGMFVVDMRAEADRVEVRRIPTVAGYTLDEIAFAGTAADLLGEAGAGRRQLARAVRAEQGGIFQLGWCHRVLAEYTDFCRRADAGTPDARRRDGLGALWIRLAAGREIAYAPVAAAAAGPPDPVRHRVGAALAKIRLTELLRDLTRETARETGSASVPDGYVAAPAAAWDGVRFAHEALLRLDGPLSVGANDLHRDAVAAQVFAGLDAGADGPLGFPGRGGDADPFAGMPWMWDVTDAYEAAVRYVAGRAAYGTTLAKLPVVRRRVADLYGDLAAAHALARRAAAEKSAAGYEETRAFAAEIAVGVAQDAIELCGGAGYLADSAAGRAYRRARDGEAADGGRTGHRAWFAERALRCPGAESAPVFGTTPHPASGPASG